MPFRCSILSCKGKYGEEDSCRLFSMPKKDPDRQLWINAIPSFSKISLKDSNIRICSKHWPSDTAMVKVAGGYTRPQTPPSIFDVPLSCLPTPKPKPRSAKVEFAHQQAFDKKDKFNAFMNFTPEKELSKKYKGLVLHRTEKELVCIFMNTDFTASNVVITVYSKSTLMSPATISAFKRGVKVPIPQNIIQPNNGLARYSQFFAAVNFVLHYEIPIDCLLSKASEELSLVTLSEKTDQAKLKKVLFLQRQLQLAAGDKYKMEDYCAAIEHYPRVRYDQLREVLVLPCSSKIRSIVSSTDVSDVLVRMFDTLKNHQQKNCMLLVDEVKIRPSIAYSGGVLQGFAKNHDERVAATSMLCVMVKCLHGGPSTMISVTPVHKLTGSYQHKIVVQTAELVEKCGGIVHGSITDNHKVNQNYCSLFTKSKPHEASHPLDSSRKWYLLFDTVHLLKCIRNNWLTEKNKELSLDGHACGFWKDIEQLYIAERDSLLRTTTLTSSAVYPSQLELQNVKHATRVFHEKVVAGLKTQKKNETAVLVEQVSNWWKTMNVRSKGESVKFKDPARACQTPSSTNLTKFSTFFHQSDSGLGRKRERSLTHDTKKALVQTMNGMESLCKELFSAGFQYVLLGELQSDRLEGEFGVYRQATGANSFMRSGDVSATFKTRLARFSAVHLEKVDTQSSTVLPHDCNTITYEDGVAMEEVWTTDLSQLEMYSVTYVAGWLETRCGELTFTDEQPLLVSKDTEFLQQLSRGGLTVPHVCTCDFVSAGLRYLKQRKYSVCCRNKLVDVLEVLNSFYSFGMFSFEFLRRLANVLLNGLHKQNNDEQSCSYKTAIKKARLS